MSLRVSVTGLVEIDADGTAVELSSLGRVGRLFWVYLVCERHRPVAKDQVADVLWGEDLPRSWEQLLRGNASKLRSVLANAGLEPAVALRSAFGTYQLHLPADAVVDLEEAGSAIERALAAIRHGDFEEAQQASAAAVAVTSRGFLAGWSGIWVEQRQVELRELRLRGLEALAQATAARHQWGEAIAAAEEAVAIEPFRESAYQLLMASHRGAGNPGEALRTYERCRRILADELGASPTAATERMYLSLLDSEPTAMATDDPSLPLPAFLEPTPASFLVGREPERGRLRAALQRATAEGRQAVLVGASRVSARRLWSPASPAKRMPPGPACCTGGATRSSEWPTSPLPRRSAIT
ncbi:MAG: bacterial transcriptional activator domain-containing protein [Actinomycetota bacterium]|nr:bacterial transcriptional activator domain-containing protein [Actinomycetota bacterium]